MLRQNQADVDAMRHAKRAKRFLLRGFVTFLMMLLPTGPYVQIPLFVVAAAFGVATLYEYQEYRIARTLSTLRPARM
jgi:hypothetical protein